MKSAPLPASHPAARPAPCRTSRPPTPVRQGAGRNPTRTANETVVSCPARRPRAASRRAGAGGWEARREAARAPSQETGR